MRFISYQRKLDFAVTSATVIYKMCELMPELKLKRYSTLLKTVYKFLKCKNFTFRRGTYIGQSLSEKYNSLITNFLKYNISKLNKTILNFAW